MRELRQDVLSTSERSELIRATLASVHAFLSWISVGYILESALVSAVFPESEDCSRDIEIVLLHAWVGEYY